jgi:hypothetical protein
MLLDQHLEIGLWGNILFSGTRIEMAVEPRTETEIPDDAVRRKKGVCCGGCAILLVLPACAFMYMMWLYLGGSVDEGVAPSAYAVPCVGEWGHQLPLSGEVAYSVRPSYHDVKVDILGHGSLEVVRAFCEKYGHKVKRLRETSQHWPIAADVSGHAVTFGPDAWFGYFYVPDGSSGRLYWDEATGDVMIFFLLRWGRVPVEDRPWWR